jgi:hypothetical protein
MAIAIRAAMITPSGVPAAMTSVAAAKTITPK